MKYTHILWDFNGTILDDLDAGIKSVNKLLSERGLPTVDSHERYYEVFGFPIIDYYRRLGFDFDKEPYEVIAPLWVELYLENVKESPIFDDILPTVELFGKMGLSQTVLSATELEMLKKQLKLVDCLDLFDEVLGIDNIYAASKVSLAEGWREKNPNAVPLMIGDTVHDAEVAERIGADCVLIARGHQSRKTLENAGCPIYEDLDEMLKNIL
ncbi:MAG: HAD family hydrolase [Clostridia bacterium]|nr:HAD family hydrolase [Clostridia bacterium]